MAWLLANTWVRSILLRASAILLPLLILFVSMARSRNLQKKVDELDAYKKTVKRARKADVSTGDSDADREWLRARGKP